MREATERWDRRTGCRVRWKALRVESDRTHRACSTMVFLSLDNGVSIVRMDWQKQIKL